MKKGFTLVELLIVVVVIVTLMTITFRLSSIGGDSIARNNTVDRLNRVENCLSGYYAAYGSYPPVALHGYRNIYLSVSEKGIQNPDEENKSLWTWWQENGNHGLGSRDELKAWAQVQAACKAQPFDCRFPYSDSYNEVIKAYSLLYKEKVQSSPNSYSDLKRKQFSATIDNGWSDGMGRHAQNQKKVKWRDVQLFKYGVMSYLLPRYLVMMSFGTSGGNSKAKNFANFVFGTKKNDENDGFWQWTKNNKLPSNPLTGKEIKSWSELFDWISAGEEDPREYAQATSIPSQAVTARWMPNLEGIVTCGQPFTLYGINIKLETDPSGGLGVGNMQNGIEVYTPDGYDSSSTAQQYLLDCVTVKDGWGSELYYYSPAPHQNYTLWSAGKNGRTFPPWISRDKLKGEGNAVKCVAFWTADDIVKMKTDK